MPIGTLMMKIHSQPAVVSSPPSTRPTGAATPPMPMKRPSALLRSGPSGKMSVINARAAGVTSAAPSPCSSRATTNCQSSAASPQPSEASVKRATPAVKSRRRPMTSAARPASSRKPAKPSR